MKPGHTLPVLAGVAFCLGLAPWCKAQPETQRNLVASSRRVFVPDFYSPDRTLPVFSNGLILTFSRTISPETPEPVMLTLPGEQKNRQMGFRLPEAPKLVLYDAASTAAGTLLFSGEFEGKEDGAKAYFFAETEIDGKVRLVVKTGTYVPTRICGSKDGSIWTLGQEPEAESKGESYALLRHFSAQGELRSSHLERSAMPADAKLSLLPPGAMFGENQTRAFLSCGDRSVGVYMGFPVSTWYVLDGQTNELRHWKAASIRLARILTLVMLSDDHVFATFQVQNGTGGQFLLHELQLSPEGRGKWEPVASGEDVVVLGNDGPNLVHLRGPRLVTGVSELHWSKVP